jgi:hypothetical protein
VRIGVRLGPVSLSTSTRSRRRSQSRQSSWHAKGHATTPDGREVDFRCQHSHRSQSAALDCASATRKQIERGRNLQLVTRVRSTPASREAARQRAQMKEAKRQAKAAQRVQKREAAAGQRAKQEALILQQQQQAESRARYAEAAQQRAGYREESAQQRSGHSAQIYRFNPPPNWPAPPPGWVPVPGWRPSPEWPAPPPGWQLWSVDTTSAPGPAFGSSHQVDLSRRPSTAPQDRPTGAS